MEIGILALQGDVSEHVRALSRCGVEPRPVRRPDDLDGLAGIILPGGESTTLSLLLESSGLTVALGTALAAGLPAFGTCAGTILLATGVSDGRPDQVCFSAVDIGVRRNGFGRQVESFETELDLDSAVPGHEDGPLPAVFIRAPLIERIGPGVAVLARAPAAPGAGGQRSPALVREGAVLAATFHPELTDDLRLHHLFCSMCESNLAAGVATPASATAHP